jgi:cytochrome c5
VVPKAIMDPSDNGRTSPTASVCSTCHDDTLSVAHMKLQGAGFTSATGAVANPVKYDVNGNLVDNTTTYVETCAVCHGTGAVVDVATVHHGQ